MRSASQTSWPAAATETAATRTSRRSRSTENLSRDSEVPRELAVVFEKRLLLRQRFRLHVAGAVGRARDDGVLAGRRAVPGVREVLPRVFAGRRLNRRG